MCGISLVVVHGLLIAVASSVAEPGRQGGRPLGAAVAGLVALGHVGSSWTRDRIEFPALQGGLLSPGPPSPLPNLMSWSSGEAHFHNLLV